MTWWLQKIWPNFWKKKQKNCRAKKAKTFKTKQIWKAKKYAAKLLLRKKSWIFLNKKNYNVFGFFFIKNLQRLAQTAKFRRTGIWSHCPFKSRNLFFLLSTLSVDRCQLTSTQRKLLRHLTQTKQNYLEDVADDKLNKKWRLNFVNNVVKYNFNQNGGLNVVAYNFNQMII